MPPEAASEQRERLQYNAAHLLKLTAHGPRPIATAQMVQEAARGKCAVSRLTSARLMSIGTNVAQSRSRLFPISSLPLSYGIIH